MRKAFEYILTRFPEYRAKIIDLYNKDEDFRILCDDYLGSADALEECRKNVIKDKEFENEYSEVHLELEKEIIHLLEMNQNKK